MPAAIKSEFGFSASDSDSALRASMSSLVSGIEQWEVHLSAFLSSYMYGSKGLSALSQCQDHIFQLQALGDTIQDMCAIFNAAFVRAASTVRRHRNSLAFINALPDEVLLPIFLEATHNHPHRKVNVFLTCSRWRNICASDSSFWSKFLVPSPLRHARRAIAAAQGRPLDLTVDFKTWNTQLQNVISQRESTVRSLTARRVSVASKDTTSWLTSSFPALRELNLESGIAYSWDDCVLPPSNSRWHEHSGSLSLWNCRFPYHAQSYSGLHSLSIIYNAPPVAEKEDSPNDRHLLDVLRACPQLEYLTLCHPPMSAHEALAALPPHPVPLHVLRRLRVQMHVQKVASFLEAIETSPEALSSIDIELTDMRHWAGHERAWHKPLLDAPLPSFSSVPAHSLPMLGRLESFALRYPSAVVGRGPTHKRPSGQPAPSSFRLALPEPRSLDDVEMRGVFDDFLAFLLSRAFLSNATCLRLEAFPSSEQALGVLRAAPRLTTLAIDAYGAGNRRVPADVFGRIASTHRHRMRPIVPEVEAIALVGCMVDGRTLADLGEAIGSLDLRVLSLERCDSELEEGQIITRLRRGDSRLDVQWVEDDPRRELRV